MIVNVADKVRIVVDTTCVTLEKRVTVARGADAGADRWVQLGYYGGVDQAANALLVKHFKLLTPIAEANVVQLIEELRKIGRQIVGACRAVQRENGSAPNPGS